MENFISKLKNFTARSDEVAPPPPSSISATGANAQPPETATVASHSRKQSPFTRKQRSTKAVTATDTSVPGSQPSNKPPRRRKPFYRRFLFWIPVVLAAGAGGATAWGYWTLEQGLPDTKDIGTFVRDGTLTMRAADNTVLQQLGPATRDKLSIRQIPPQVIQAFIAAEDRRFYQHNGVDLQSILRAIASNLMARDLVEGASTITQQLSRIVYLNQEQTFWRKLQEAMLAQKIERQLSKDQVLEKYLNLVYLGSGAYGVADAAWVYFSKPVNQLTLSETATIAGLPPAPSDYSPLVNRQTAQVRRDIVLARMQEAGFITAADADTARAEPLTLKPSTPKKLYSDTPYFTSYVQQQLPKLVSKEQLEVGGLTVETTLNASWQKIADKVVRDTVKNTGPYEGFQQASLVAIDPRNGEIRAMVGGTDFAKSQFNRVTQAQRQPGSSFKPILYATAIATGISPYATYLDAPYTIDGYKPENYGKKYSGWISLRDALTSSVNVISVRLLVEVGFDPVIKLGQDMGIKSKLLPTYSLALGASEVNLLELANAYATLAAQGKYIEAHGIRRILDRKGKVIYDAKFNAKQAVDKDTVAIITWMMQNVVNSGTGRAAQLDRQVAGKTGTSEEARDLWFIGFIPQLVAGVWLGNDDSTPTWSYSSTAASVWHDFMVAVTKGMPVEKFAALPSNLDSRKGTLKAKPVKPSQVVNGEAPDKTDRRSKKPTDTASPKLGGESGKGTPEPGNVAPTPTDSPAPVPSSDPSAPPPSVEPAPPPENTAPPLPPPVAPEPAPPPVTPQPAPGR